ncbi:DUF6082 family protein [Actinoplanes sp. TFC3]|uniref:DUF6082 family protein n=1 Tax=Actinoplanes sp. TFC3 TaxID=1710355 RepID=UPI000830224D|nr:DUF6082 family protein [Actinoplanes sp. TFC3]
MRNRYVLAAGALLAGLVLIAALLGLGTVAVAIMAPVQDSAGWRRWADVGQSFGVLSTVVSGLAFVALIITLWIQMKELSFQRDELRMQRGVAERSRDELRRSADAGMRMLHVELLKMSLDDPSLAQVWPEFRNGSDPHRQRQMAYANLVFQHSTLSMVMAGYTDDQIRDSLRYLFASDLMRAYWREGAAVRRQTQKPGTEHWRIAQIGDEVCQEFDHPAAGSA